MMNSTQIATMNFSRFQLSRHTSAVDPYATNGPTYGIRFPIPVRMPMITAYLMPMTERLMQTTTAIKSASISCPRT